MCSEYEATRSEHDNLDHKRYNLGDLRPCITLADLESSNHDRSGLHWDRDDVGALPLGSYGVFRPCAFHVSRCTLGLAHKLVEVSTHVFLVNLPDVRLAVMHRKIQPWSWVRGSRNLLGQCGR